MAKKTYARQTLWFKNKIPIFIYKVIQLDLVNIGKSIYSMIIAFKIYGVFSSNTIALNGVLENLFVQIYRIAELTFAHLHTNECRH